jgi:uncharacterized Fe-S cluster-containing radical SAM superfamily protein
LYGSLDTFRITGGEPLLSKDTWKVLDYILETDTPNKNLKLSINSNLGINDELINKLIIKLDKIIKNNRQSKKSSYSQGANTNFLWNNILFNIFI